MPIQLRAACDLGEDGGAVQRRIERRIRRQREEKEECGDATTGIRRARSDAGSWWAQKSSRKMSCGSDGVGQKPTHSAVTRPEPHNYDKKRRFRAMREKGTGWRVGYRAGNDGFAQRLLALTAHQHVTNFTDSKRSFVFVFLRPASPKSSSPHGGAHPLRRELRTSAPFSN
jgi:hypothetical protein